MILFRQGEGCTAIVTEVTSHNGVLSFDTTTLYGARGRDMDLNRDDQRKLVEFVLRCLETGVIDESFSVDGSDQKHIAAREVG